MRPFVGIVAHRVGPEILPASRLLLGVVFAIHMLIYMLDLYVLDTRGPRLLALPLLDASAQVLFFGGLLTVMGFPQRVLQTLTAAFGTDLVLELIYLPLAFASQAGAGSGIAALSALGALLLLLWSLAVKGHILERATGLPYFVGVTIALGFSLALYALDVVLYGTT